MVYKSEFTIPENDMKIKISFNDTNKKFTVEKYYYKSDTLDSESEGIPDPELTPEETEEIEDKPASTFDELKNKRGKK